MIGFPWSLKVEYIAHHLSYTMKFSLILVQASLKKWSKGQRVYLVCYR